MVSADDISVYLPHTLCFEGPKYFVLHLCSFSRGCEKRDLKIFIAPNLIQHFFRVICLAKWCLLGYRLVNVFFSIIIFTGNCVFQYLFSKSTTLETNRRKNDIFFLYIYFFVSVDHSNISPDNILKLFSCVFFKSFPVFLEFCDSLFFSCLLACNAIFLVSELMRSSASPQCRLK